MKPFSLALELRQDEAGLWIAEMPQLRGVWVRSPCPKQAAAEAKALAITTVLDSLSGEEDAERVERALRELLGLPDSDPADP